MYLSHSVLSQSGAPFWSLLVSIYGSMDLWIYGSIYDRSSFIVKRRFSQRRRALIFKDKKLSFGIQPRVLLT